MPYVNPLAEDSQKEAVGFILPLSYSPVGFDGYFHVFFHCNKSYLGIKLCLVS